MNVMADITQDAPFSTEFPSQSYDLSNADYLRTEVLNSTSPLPANNFSHENATSGDLSNAEELEYTSVFPTRPNLSTRPSGGHISKDVSQLFRNIMWNCLVPVISLIGIFGNIFGIWFLLHEKIVRQPFHLYLLALMIVDLIFLLFSAVRNGLIIAEHYDSYLADRLSCYYSTKLQHTQSTVYSACGLLITLMALERLVNIIFPLRVKLFRLRSYTIILITVVVLLSVISGWPAFASGSAVEREDPVTKKVICEIVESEWVKANKNFMNGYTLAILIILRFTPPGITLIANLVLVVYLVRRKTKRQSLFEEQRNKEQDTEQVKITFTLFILSTCLVLALVPTATASILTNFFPDTYGRKMVGFYTQLFFRDFGYLMRVISSANDFFIYVLISKAKRYHFRKMVSSACCSLKQKQITSSAQTHSKEISSEMFDSSVSSEQMYRY